MNRTCAPLLILTILLAAALVRPSAAAANGLTVEAPLAWSQRWGYDHVNIERDLRRLETRASDRPSVGPKEASTPTDHPLSPQDDATLRSASTRGASDPIQQDITFGTPDGIVHPLLFAIREGARTRALLPITFVAGIAISIIELACTGQAYLHTILFLLGVPHPRARDGLFLGIYNAVFVSPLVVVFVLAYLGTTSLQLRLCLHHHMAKVRLIAAILFFVLRAWMVTALL